MHSDFHAHPDYGVIIGATLKEEDIRAICEKAKPDFIQIDCKGHPGYASYPSDIGNAMPMAFDTLEMWRRITNEYGILLYMHVSGVQDVKYCTEHPDDAVISPDRRISKSVRIDKSGRYLDDCFIPQICEVAKKYNVDGIWVDGDCWSVGCDYRPETLKRFEAKTGISLNGFIPAKKGDPHFDEYLEFTREEYREYLRYYVDKLHESFPELEICANWAFSDYMPEPISANVDFLSGDLDSTNCVNSARYAGRMLAMHNKPWDLMSWGFRYNVYGVPLIPPKHHVQLMQEAASVIALGGAYQNNLLQFSDGSPDIDRILMNVPLAEFVRERRPYCYGGKITDQAVMLIPSCDRYKEMSRPFTREGKEKLLGLTALLCDSGESLGIINDAILKDNKHNTEKYPLIIIPELYDGMDEETVEILRSYVLEGGSLMAVGAKTAELLSNAGFPYEVEEYNEYPYTPGWMFGGTGYIKRTFPGGTPSYLSVGNGADYGVTLGALIVKSKNDASVIAKLHPSLQDKNGSPTAVVLSYGKGRLGVIGTNLGTQYLNCAQYQHREIIRKMTTMLYNPIAKIESAEGIAEIVCLSVEGKLMLQILNAGGSHRDRQLATENYIPPLRNTVISLREDIDAKNIVLQPEGVPLKAYRCGARTHFKIPEIKIHSIAVIE